jgi:Leu/Phe-tRNA-protein transferase
MRGWTLLDDCKVIDAATEARIKVVVQEINRIELAREQERFLREGEFYAEDDHDFEDEAELAAYKEAQRMRAQRAEAELNALYRRLEELGGRMMRPYEHWNEDEAYMAYMERDRD